MKKTAVLIYDSFCNFELSVALEVLAFAPKEITVFAATKAPVKSEEGLTVLPDRTIFEPDIDEYDSLLLTGAADIRSAIENPDILDFIRKFSDKAIGAISIAPILLVKSGVMGDRPFMAGINKEDLFEEGFTEAELARLHGWDDNLKDPVAEGYILSGNILTSVSYNFAKFGLAFGRMLGIDVSPKTFGV